MRVRWSWLIAGVVAFVSATALHVPAQSPSAGALTDAPTRLTDSRTGINPWQTQLFLNDVSEFASTHVGSIRIDLPWEQVEPGPDVFAWEELDRVVDDAHAAGMDLLITLRSISSWGTKRPAEAQDEFHGARLPLDMRRWETFVTTMARRYKGRGVAYEIENEPNSTFWAGTMAEYLTLLKVSQPAIQRADPDAIVVSGALACHVVFDYPNSTVEERQRRLFDDWQRAILATHAFNRIGVHDYYFPDHAVNGWTFANYLTHVEDFARSAGCGSCPIWITESGYVSRPQRAGRRTDPGSPEQQAAWMRQMLEQAFANAGVERTYWLFLRDHPNTGYFASMGLFEGSQPRPALAVLAQSRSLGPAGSSR